MKISIIVPVYRVEAYLNQCVDSVLSQDYPDFELILVDDGSPDRCGEICDNYAAADSRVQVIHKANGGLSDARNAGMSVARGAYVLFLDSDDYWNSPQVLSHLVNRIQLTGADLLNFSYRKFYEDTGAAESYFSVTESMPQPMELSDQLSWLTDRGLYIASACNKMIRRSLLEDAPFRAGVFSEDIEWCASLLVRAKSVDYIPEAFYCYRQRSSSIRHSIQDRNCDDLTDAILRCLHIAETAEEPYREPLLRYTAFQYGTFFAVQAQAENPQKACIAQLQPHAGILRHHGNNRKLRILGLGCRILGYSRLCALIRKLYHIKNR